MWVLARGMLPPVRATNALLHRIEQSVGEQPVAVKPSSSNCLPVLHGPGPPSNRRTRHLTLHPVDGSGTNAKRPGRLQDSRAGRQFCTDTLEDIVADWTTPETFFLCWGACKTGIGPASNQ